MLDLRSKLFAPQGKAGSWESAPDCMACGRGLSVSQPLLGILMWVGVLSFARCVGAVQLVSGSLS